MISLSAVKNEGKAKRIFILPVIFAAVGAIINVGSMAAIGYFSNGRDLNDATRVASKAGAAKTALKHLKPAVTAISRVHSFFIYSENILTMGLRLFIDGS